MNKIQTLAEYQQLAARTCPDLGSPLKNGIHMVMGFKTEIGEALDCLKKPFAYGKPFDKVNLGEEFADAAWYIANEMRLAGRELNEKEVTESSIGSWKEAFVEILESSKKDFQYDSEFDAKVHTYMQIEDMLMEQFNGGRANPETCIHFLMVASEFWEIDFYQALTNNIDKLRVRYPEKFTGEAALNRNLEAERKELEK